MIAFNVTGNIYCYNADPPTATQNTFSNYNAVLHVPAASLAAYFTAPIWQNFNNIIGDAEEPLSINLSNEEIEILIGNQIVINASLVPASAYPDIITWRSSDASVATVSNGIVSAKSIGECDRIATCLDKQAICHVYVIDNTITINLDQQSVNVLPNHIITLVVSSSSDLLPNLVVESSDPSVAAARIVNDKIQVVGIKEGTTTLTVGSVDGTAIPAKCEVTVYTEPGDVNCDGYINISDVTILIDYLLSGNPEGLKVDNADTNRDGQINISDVTSLIDMLLIGNF